MQSIAHVSGSHTKMIPLYMWEKANGLKNTTALQQAIQAALLPLFEEQSAATEKAGIEIVKLLIKHGADVNAECPHYEPVVKMLAEAGAQINDIPGKWRKRVRQFINPDTCCIQ